MDQLFSEAAFIAQILLNFRFQFLQAAIALPPFWPSGRFCLTCSIISAAPLRARQPAWNLNAGTAAYNVACLIDKVTNRSNKGLQAHVTGPVAAICIHTCILSSSACYLCATTSKYYYICDHLYLFKNPSSINNYIIPAKCGAEYTVDCI